ncbi:MAG: hypothetical protein Q4D56_04435 [Bacteroides sp.]|nr:hypothetical protein [Bacteroides sp.]
MRINLIFRWVSLLSLVMIVAVLSSCSDDTDKGKASATLILDKATSHSLSFTITPQYAEQCAWVCVKKGNSVPAAEEILSTGIPVDVSSTTTQTAIALEAQTDYIIVAAAARSGRSFLSSPLEVTTLEKTELPEEDDTVYLTQVIEAYYSTDNSANAGNYLLTFSTDDLDSNGYPARVGDVMLTIDLYNASDEDPVNATLPSGEYQPQSDYSAFSWNPSYSVYYKRIGAGDSGVSASLISSGVVTVEREGDIYSVLIDVVTLTGEVVKASYTGTIVFVQTGTSSYERFTTPQNVDFEIGQGRYYGNWYYPHADDLSLQFFQGTFDENGSLTDGYYLTLSSTYMNKLADYNMENPPLEEGTYTIGTTSTSTLQKIPFTIDPGSMQEIWGTSMAIGSYMTYIDASTGRQYIGLITGGSFTVTRSGNEYNIDFDFVSTEGISLKGTFNGEISMANYNDNDTSTMNPKRPWSTLTQNVQLNFPEDTQALIYYMGDYLYPGLASWWLLVSSATQDKGDMITAEFFAPLENGMELQSGTYTVSRKFEAFQMLPGFQPYGGGAVAYTWYGDLSSVDSEGYATVMAPIEEGTMTLQKEENGTYRFVFDFKDDAGYTVTGEWSGAATIAEYGTETSSSGIPTYSVKRKGLMK